MLNKNIASKFLFTTIRRFVSSNSSSSSSSSKTGNVRSFLVRLLEDHRKQIQHEDIRLEPYISKGVYTESGAIRPVIFVILLIIIY